MTDPYAPPPGGHPPPYGPPQGYGPPGYAPYPPPRPRRPLDKQVVALAVAIATIVTAGFGTVVVRGIGGGIEQVRAEERAAREQAAAADKAFDDAMAGPADTATASPAPDGSRRYESPPVEDGQHGFHLRLPRGWEGRHVGVRQDQRHFSDSVLTRPGGGAVMVVDRVRFGVRLDSPRFEEALRADIQGGDEVVSGITRLTPATIGDGEPAQHLFAQVTYDDGERKQVRVVAIEHGGETFEVVQLWDIGDGATEAQLERILASWRWG